jgi:hypothetical protein
MLQPADEHGDLWVRPGHAIDLVRRQQTQDGGQEDSYPGEEPAGIRARHAIPVFAIRSRQCDWILHRARALYRLDAPHARQSEGSAR